MIDDTNRFDAVVAVVGSVSVLLFGWAAAGWLGLVIAWAGAVVGASLVAVLSRPFLDDYEVLLQEKIDEAS